MKTRIGPNALYMSLWFILYSPVTWGCALVIAAMLLPLFMNLSGWPDLAVSLFILAARTHLGTIGFGLLLLHTGAAFIRSYTTNYEMSEDALVIAHGYLSPYSRAGWLHRDVNTIPLNFVDDADFTQTIVQQAAKVGCVTIKTVQGENAYLPFVEDPDGVRAAIMQRSGVAKTRVFARVEP
ncbi:MAG: PH domain-containing protein [Opitutaceae bacterium]|nr:PH domain-containing protein [Opitutaceae bacterium]